MKNPSLCLFVTFVSVFLTKAEVEVTITNCSPPNSHASNVEFEYSPNPAVLGEKLTINGTCDYSIDDESPFYHLSGNFGIIPLVDHTDTLCQKTSVDLPLDLGELVVNGLSGGCPLKAGPVGLSVVLPELVFLPGTLKAELNATSSASGNTELCIDIAIKISIQDDDGSQKPKRISKTN